VSKTSTSTQRIFIGLWPDKAAQTALHPLSAAALQHCGGRALRPDQWHITLAFLGSLSMQDVDGLCAQASEWQLPTAPFCIDHYGYFKQAGIVWVGSQETVSLQQMAACHRRLWQYLLPLGYRPEQRPFVPHVSLLRQAESCTLDALSSFIPFDWYSAHCYVVESRPTARGTHYIPLCEIALRPHL